MDRHHDPPLLPLETIQKRIRRNAQDDSTWLACYLSAFIAFFYPYRSGMIALVSLAPSILH